MHDPKAIRTTNSRSHPLIQRQQVLPQTVKQAPKPRAQAVLGILQPDRNRRTQMPQFLGRNQSVFSHQAADLVAFRLALIAQLKAHPVYGLNVLLLYRLHRHEAHVRPAHRFADRLRIIGVVLVALHIRLHELRRNQLHRNSVRLECSRPVVRATTSLHADHAARFNRSSNALNQFARVNFRRNVTFSFRSTPCTWNTAFAKSTPTRISFIVDPFSPLTGR